MTEDLRRLIQATKGQSPSADFVARLRAQVIAETEGTGAGRDGFRFEEALRHSVIEGAHEHDGIVIVLEPPLDLDNELATHRALGQRRAQRLASVAAVGIVFIGLWASISAFRDDGPVLPDTATATVTAGPTEPDDDDGGVQLLTGDTFFDAGTFRIDTLGTAFTFSVNETTGLALNDNGVVMITDLTSSNADDRTVTFRRTALLPDPADPTAEVDPAEGWPATDLNGWLAAVGEEVTADNPVRTTLGGLGATFVELEFPCGEVNCAAGDLLQSDLLIFTPGSHYRVWVVDQADQDPVLVVVAIDDHDEAAWFDEADDILASLVFESIEPNPVRRAPAGAVELAVFDGISLDLPEEVVVVEPFDGFARILPQDIGGDVELLARPLDTDGVEVATTEQLLRLLADEAVEVTEHDAIDVGGFEARSFGLASGPYPNIVLKARTADLARTEFGWETPQVGNLWIVEHPVRGLLLVSAEALKDRETIDLLQPWAEELLATLEFVAP